MIHSKKARWAAIIRAKRQAMRIKLSSQRTRIPNGLVVSSRAVTSGRAPGSFGGFPPNDVKKGGILKDWLRSIPEDAKRVQAGLVRSGIEAEKWWIG
ncbi:MAG: hypothetical protein KAW94_07555 [Candidatus Thorarchaeota archaeon]|nr:hypothetical protein [Candidatus Thorarchaeota archaeon]